MPSLRSRFGRAARKDQKTSARRMFRYWIKPPRIPEKNDHALKFGILGSASSVYTILILPAVYHADVKVHAIACDNRRTCQEWRRRYGIRRAYTSYQVLLDDAEIDAVLIALEPPLRLEWTIRALAKGKHVLLDAPGTSSAVDAERLFNGPFVGSANCPVLLECTPYRFHPGWLEFERVISRRNVARVKILVVLPATFDKDKDLQFRLEHSGGARLDMGYATSLMRAIYGVDPVKCLRSEVDVADSADSYGEHTQYDLTWLFPGGAVGEMKGVVVLGKRMGVPVLSRDAGVTIEVLHRRLEVPVGEAAAAAAAAATSPSNALADRRMQVTRRVTLRYRDGPPSRHRLTIEEEAVFCDRETGRVVHRTRGSKSLSAYTLRAADRANRSLPESKPYWTAPLYQLDAFVNRVRGTSPSPRSAWVTPADSLARARAMDDGLRAAGIVPPPPSTFRLEDLQLTPQELERFAVPPPQAESSGLAGGSHQAEGSCQPQEPAQTEGLFHQAQQLPTRTGDRVRPRPSGRSSRFIRAWLDALSARGEQEETPAGSGGHSDVPSRQGDGSGSGSRSALAHGSRQTQSNTHGEEVPIVLRTSLPDGRPTEAHETAEARSPPSSSLRSRSSARARRSVQNRFSVRVSRLAQVLGPNHIRVRALRYFQSLKAAQSQCIPQGPQGQGEAEDGVELSRMPSVEAYEPPQERGPSPSLGSARSRQSGRPQMSAQAHRLARASGRSQARGCSPGPEASDNGPQDQDAAQAEDSNAQGRGEEGMPSPVLAQQEDRPAGAQPAGPSFRAWNAGRGPRGREGQHDSQG
ncbi:hypothetical protein VTG60DRAFT_355 [Thermothelomyces hinnuleus]